MVPWILDVGGEEGSEGLPHPEERGREGSSLEEELSGTLPGQLVG